MNDNVLTYKQLFWLFLSMQVIMNMLLTPSGSIMIAQQDAWLSALIAILISLVTLWSSIKVCARYPSMDFHVIIETIAGKWIGRLLSIFLLVSFTVVLAVMLRQYGEFVSGTVLPKTPISVIIFCILVTAIYPTFHGLGVIGRLAEIFGPILLLGIISPIILGIVNMDVKHLLPFWYDSGILAIITGSLGPAAFLTDCVLILWIFNLSEFHPNKIKYLTWSILTSGLLYLLSVTSIIATFGVKIASTHLYPFLILERYISIFGMIENLDAIVITVWILSIFLKICLYLFVTSYGFSMYTAKINRQKMVFYIAGIAFFLSLLPRNVVDISIEFPQVVGVPFILPFWVILPLFLSLTIFIKDKINKTQ
ncbi:MULTISPECIES: GerAB/ArcD/ProY family transporter [Psychrobacillus]|uniref:GerAB/ArcD/ProY family transporter n=1 Tax=Psychrobacillus TaxID=1221880 RepID=UPI0008E74FB7|nr:endospore germination permease [Psychrobacillus psychrodurans]SFM98515.1 spore germination protein KB [Psychrobacillus psychrodurans]